MEKRITLSNRASLLKTNNYITKPFFHVPKHISCPMSYPKLVSKSTTVQIVQIHQQKVPTNFQHKLVVPFKIVQLFLFTNMTNQRYDASLGFQRDRKDSSEGFCSHVDTSCKAANVARTCGSFSQEGGPCHLDGRMAICSWLWQGKKKQF